MWFFWNMFWYWWVFIGGFRLNLCSNVVFDLGKIFERLKCLKKNYENFIIIVIVLLFFIKYFLFFFIINRKIMKGKNKLK